MAAESIQGSPVRAARLARQERLTSALAHVEASGYLPSERWLLLQAGLPAALFYKIRQGIQAPPPELAESLCGLFGLSRPWVERGGGAMFAPTHTEGLRPDAALALRLISWALHESLALPDLSLRLALPQSEARNWTRHRGPLSSKALHALLASSPTLAGGWLMAGLGQPMPSYLPPQGAPVPEGLAQAPPIVYLQQAPLPAQAGFAEGFADQQAGLEYIPVRTTLAGNKEAYLVEVTGTSMEPTLIAGDKVIATPVPRAAWGTLSPGQAYILAYPGERLVIKRLAPGAQPGHLRLTSDNPAFSPVEIETESIHSILQVRQLIREKV